VSLQDNFNRVLERVERASARSGRHPSPVTLIAVTKVFPPGVILEAYALGHRDFGENYVQEFESKYPAVNALEGARFHLIGHLQSNKSRKAAELFDVIQTVDSAKLARRLQEAGKPLQVMIEVKLSPEEAKHGADPESLAEVVNAIRGCPGLRLTGLMTMPPWSENPEESRPYFARLRALAEEHHLSDLSMGMSHDLEVAIEEGATHIRVGTALFGKRQRP
jgi:pyridoxal phosphate enzyme (YggS family)